MGYRISVLVACIAFVLVAALPAAANDKPTTGPRISVVSPPTTFPANSPFHIEHGFACLLSDVSCIREQMSAKADFDLFVDGVLQPSTLDIDLDDGLLLRFHLTNYASGLPPGTHTFHGIWYLNGNEVFTRTAEVEFT